ncbi:MAG: hypothetical protein ACE3JQ_00940 [Paenisporosarcina sp.]
MVGIFCVILGALLGFGLLHLPVNIGIYIMLGAILGVLSAIYIQLDVKLRAKIKSIVFD